ncbi:kinase-like domain-containing protein [Phialemonium atrogriseum]|uniref:Kinase-like domain-containing protein n=1 Tax=Phialemonium atrogriseum TaxID=1093897 RepID=A0AAJ0BSP1_9PEZI|nr:kinase-like domain-containing protein [Phialemonium atrogriseum]KAK1763745.1 kinase-like domain-containing protein [Phialemonium atrogriseum]
MSTHDRVLKFAHLFKEGEDSYLFVDRLGDGCFSHAQKVWHVQSRKIMVRKVRHRRLESKDVTEPDTEVRTLSLLEKAPSMPGITPRLAKLRAYADIPRVTRLPGSPLSWTRVSYWDFYNGGDLGAFIKASGNDIPMAAIARYARQALESLEFCHSAGVIHGDLNTGNVWVHWEAGGKMPDFYLGDFGNAATMEEVNEWTTAVGTPVKSWDIPSVRAHVWEMIYRNSGGDADVDEVIRGAGRLGTVVWEMDRLDKVVKEIQASGAMFTRFPSLSKLIRLAGMAEDHFLRVDKGEVDYRAPHEDSISKAQNARPLYYDDAETPLQARLILGPWYVASVDTRFNFPESHGEVAHSRPNPNNSDSDSDSMSKRQPVRRKGGWRPDSSDEEEDDGWCYLSDSGDILSSDDTAPLLGPRENAVPPLVTRDVVDAMMEATRETLI